MQRTRIYVSSVAKNSKRPANMSVTPDLRQRHSTAHEGARKAQQPNSHIRHARMHADHHEQIKYTCKRVNSVGNAELPARGAEPRMSEPKRLENKPGALSACRTLQKARECLKTDQKVSEDPKTAAQSQNYLVQAQIHAQRGHRGPETAPMHPADACIPSATELTQNRLQEHLKSLV